MPRPERPMSTSFWSSVVATGFPPFLQHKIRAEPLSRSWIRLLGNSRKWTAGVRCEAAGHFSRGEITAKGPFLNSYQFQQIFLPLLTRICNVFTSYFRDVATETMENLSAGPTLRGRGKGIIKQGRPTGDGPNEEEKIPLGRSFHVEELFGHLVGYDVCGLLKRV